MRQRCNDRACEKFRYYGGRGIKVCARWDSFDNFVADMGEKPPGHTLERMDTNADYEPRNCRWATWKEQQNNKRNNRRLTFDGRTLTVSQWADEVKLPKRVLFDRLRLHWPVVKILTAPLMQSTGFALTKRRLITHDGETLTQTDWSRRTGLSAALICYRLKHHWTVAQALTTPAKRA